MGSPGLTICLLLFSESEPNPLYRLPLKEMCLLLSVSRIKEFIYFCVIGAVHITNWALYSVVTLISLQIWIYLTGIFFINMVGLHRSYRHCCTNILSVHIGSTSDPLLSSFLFFSSLLFSSLLFSSLHFTTLLFSPHVTLVVVNEDESSINLPGKIK